MLNDTYKVVLKLKAHKDAKGNWVKPKINIIVEKTIDCPTRAIARIFALNEVENNQEQWIVICTHKA
jgi:hypothetical protein